MAMIENLHHRLSMASKACFSGTHLERSAAIEDEKWANLLNSFVVCVRMFIILLVFIKNSSCTEAHCAETNGAEMHYAETVRIKNFEIN